MATQQIGQVIGELSSRLETNHSVSSETLNGIRSEIELTEQETAAALCVARQIKFDRLELERRRQESESAEREIRRDWNAIELSNYIGNRAINEFGFSANEGKDGKPQFVVDENNRFIIEALCMYFTNDPVFETMGEGWKLNKGLCLFGNVGLGKSMLMRLFTRNKRQCYSVISCRQVADLFAKDGEGALLAYSGIKNETFSDPTVFYQRKTGYCFDDLGTETDKMHWGNRSNVMGEILLNRYDRIQSGEYAPEFTHITTNLTADEIEQAYGTRVRSRFREMFNPIKSIGNDRRK